METGLVVYGSTGNEDIVCNVEGRRLMEFCENIAFEDMNGKCESYTRQGYISVNWIAVLLFMPQPREVYK
jgi:hypothetical protein